MHRNENGILNRFDKCICGAMVEYMDIPAASEVISLKTGKPPLVYT